MKFCKDCKHYTYHSHGIPQHVCDRAHVKTIDLSPVTGEYAVTWSGRPLNAAVERQDFYDSCGEQAKYFEAKP